MTNPLKKYGFTLVELLAVIAGIGLMLALLMPTVQSAREEARRATCANKVKQITFALHNFHDVNGHLPGNGNNSAWRPYKFEGADGREEYLWGTDNYSFLVVILPFIGEQALYETIHADCRNRMEMGEEYASHSGDVIFRTSAVGTLFCPSDDAAVLTTDMHPTSYRGCVSDTYSQRDVFSLPTINPPQDRGHYDINKLRGIMVTGPRPATRTGNGGFKWGTIVRFEDAADGLSNTVAISESLIGENNLDGETRYQVAIVALPEVMSLIFTPKQCFELKGENGNLKQLGGIDAGYGRKGTRWADGHVGYSGFHAILPPNSPSCVFTDSSDWAVEGFGAVTVSSNHAGGVNASMLDGSVRFIPDTIDCGDLSEITFPNRVNPESAYGVWGAMGTIAGGESLSTIE